MSGICDRVALEVGIIQRETFITTKDTDACERRVLDAFDTERRERALDQLLRAPDKETASGRSALGNASTVLQGRTRQRGALVCLDAIAKDGGTPVSRPRRRTATR